MKNDDEKKKSNIAFSTHNNFSQKENKSYVKLEIGQKKFFTLFLYYYIYTYIYILIFCFIYYLKLITPGLLLTSVS